MPRTGERLEILTVTMQASHVDLDRPADRTMKARASKLYASGSRDALEEQWIVQHLPLVRHIVGRIVDPLSIRSAGAGRHNCMDVEDLISAGTLGLVKAARAYDPSRQAVFKTYAYIRIRGAVIDELRGRSFVPATVFGQLRRIEAAHQRIASAHGRPPGDAELAAEVGISQAQLYRTLQEARRTHFLSIHGLTDDQPALGALVPASRSPSPEAAAERKEMSRRLAAAIKELSERDRMILLLYYDRDLTMKETAHVLGITESRVSQLHASALFKLSMELRESS